MLLPAQRASAGCTGLTAMYVSSATAPEITTGTFADIVKSNCKLFVPQGKAEAYSSWKSYFSTIVDKETFQEEVGGVLTTFVITSDKTVQLGDGTAAIDPSTTAYTIPETVDHDGVTYTVTAIGDKAFYECSSLKGDIDIPSTVTSLGRGAFYNCTSITRVTIPQGITVLPPNAFYGCSNMSSISLPEGLLGIMDHALYDLKNLSTLTLPSTIEFIGELAITGNISMVVAKMMNPCSLTSRLFKSSTNCQLYVPYGMRDAYINKGWTEELFTRVLELSDLYFTTTEGVKVRCYIKSEQDVTILQLPDETPAIDIATEGPLTIPATFEYMGKTFNVVEIGDDAFLGCKGLTAVTLPEGLKSVGKRAFWKCENLANVSLPTSLEEIGSWAFRACNLTSVWLRNGLKKVGGYAFCENKNITTITLPETVESLAEGIFQETSLITVQAMGINPPKLNSQSVFITHSQSDNNVIMTVPYATRQRYLDAGYTESTPGSIGVVGRIVEEVAVPNNVFLIQGKGASACVHYQVNGLEGVQWLNDGYALQLYLRSDNGFAAINFLVEEGHSVKVLRNGQPIDGIYELGEGTIDYLDGWKAYKLTAVETDNDYWRMDGATNTWQVVVTDDAQQQQPTTLLGDVNEDGKVTVADVTTLVNIILGKGDSPRNVQLEYDVTLPKSLNGIVNIPLDDALLSAFGVTEDYVNENILQFFSAEGPEAGKLMFFVYDTDGTTMLMEDYLPVASSYQAQSYWYDTNGEAVPSESSDKLDINKLLCIGHNAKGFYVQGYTYADASFVGTTHKHKMGLMYNVDGKIYTATVTLNITIVEASATGSYVKK